MGKTTDGMERSKALRLCAYRTETVRSMERPLLERGVPLMRMAASATAQVTAQLLEDSGIDVIGGRVSLLAGAGDNGGDGLFAAAALARAGAEVTVIAVGKSLHPAGLIALTRSGGKLLILDPGATMTPELRGFGAGEAGERLRAAIKIVAKSDVLLDAMTGIGVTGALRGLAATMAHEICSNIRQANENGARAPLVIAIDTPSGIGVDDGTIPGDVIDADATVMFGAMKPCAMLPPASFACGQVTLVDFGFDLTGRPPAVSAMNQARTRTMLRRPKTADSKYSRGVAGLITGSTHYPGAAVLSVEAAMHSNTGMVRYLGPAIASGMVLDKAPEVVLGKGRVQAWAVGSGVPANSSSAAHDEDGHTDGQREAIATLLAHYALPDWTDGTPSDDGVERPDHLDNFNDSDTTPHHMSNQDPWSMPPICVDAGALDLLPQRVPPQVIITPHAAELARLLTNRGQAVTTDDITDRPWHWATRAHKLTGATVLLKGAITIVVGEDSVTNADVIDTQNDGSNDTTRRDTDTGIDADSDHTITVVSGSGPAWLSTAGSGDVLAGLMSGVLAQQPEGALQRNPGSAVQAAATSAFVHGIAAAEASESDCCGWRPPYIYDSSEPAQHRKTGHPIVASDVIGQLPHVFGMLLNV